MTQPLATAEFRLATEWLTWMLGIHGRRTTPNPDITSYQWKHIAEKWHADRLKAAGLPGDGYISNGMFIAACIAKLLPVRRIPMSANALIGIRSAAAKPSTIVGAL